MELQKQFSQEYLFALKNQLEDTTAFSLYKGDVFSIDDNEDNVVRIPGVYNKQVDLVVSNENKPADDDYENSVKFYDAYKSLSPLIASQESFWAYLTHIEYFQYVKKRWQISSDTSIDSMVDHFFVTSMLKIARNGLARLWWPAFLTYDVSHENPYHLTKVFFTNTQVVQLMSESQFFMCKPITHGVLEFFEEHTEIELTKKAIDKVMPYINKLGGVRQIAFEEKEFFKNTIEKEIDFNS
ncbi:MAG: DUF6339 family protein [Bacteroidaceae bacterium]|nr:DUF6339 family protein [Bacteroidaceae bacterium]